MLNEGFSDSVLYLFLIGSAISLVASLLSIMFYLCNKKLHILSIKIVFHAQCANFLASLTNCLSFLVIYTLNVNKDSDFCVAHSFLMNYFNFLTILFTSNISYILYLSIFYPDLPVERMGNIGLFGSLVLAGFISLIPYFLKTYGISPQICYLSINESTSSQNYLIIRIMFYFIPIWLILLSNFYFYFRCLAFLKKQFTFSKNLKDVQNLLYFPLFLIVCWLLMGIFRILECFMEFKNQGYLCSAVFLSTLNGFFDALLFFKHPQILKVCKVLKKQPEAAFMEADRWSLGKIEQSKSTQILTFSEEEQRQPEEGSPQNGYSINSEES